MIDQVTIIGKSLVQHGEVNDRIYLMKMDEADYPQILDELDDLAQERGYSKIFAKIPEVYKVAFLDTGYEEEALVPAFYHGREGAAFLGKYLQAERKSKDGEQLSRVLKAALARQTKTHTLQRLENQEKILSGPETEALKTEGFSLCSAGTEDVPEMVQVYKRVFRTYPFPIHDEDYILKTMKENVLYFCVKHQDRIVALSSSEQDFQGENVEMTDFATLPEFRGFSLAMRLLEEMERKMKTQGMKTAYTIARALSYGMNITFAKLGYAYAGTLINNTNISGKLESMNVWYKQL